jgi:predicted nicotinamide N-methyase
MNQARRQILHRIHRAYHTVTSSFRVGEMEFRFERIADPDRVLDQVADAEDRLEKLSGRRSHEDQLHLPYWAELWDSALGIAEHLAANRSLLASQTSVLDLGCGMGLAGMVAARLGARVLFADLEAPALLFARLNSLPDSARVRTRRLDWRTDRLAEKFDLIIGADILYERKQWDYLEPFWRAHLKHGAPVLLGEPGRQTGDLFLDWIRERAWSLTQWEQSVPTREKPIRLLEIRPIN